MGGGTYSYENRVNRSMTMGYDTKNREEIFSKRSLDNEMSPLNLGIRESRDSEEHPNSLAIILGLDVTGSMGNVPHSLIQNGLPEIMKKIIDGGEADPQVLFLGIGDHECDNAPIQVSQFESNDELLDKWLTTVYLEGGGGGNGGESYLLAWYMAAFHTSIDCFEKRGRKGYLFTIGDEPPLMDLPAKALFNLFGNGQYKNYVASELIGLASKKYNIYHINMAETLSGHRMIENGIWKQLLGDNYLNVGSYTELNKSIVEKIEREVNNAPEELKIDTIKPEIIL